MLKRLSILLTLAVTFSVVMTVPAEAAAPLKALIVTGQDRAHKWAETTPLLKRWLEETGLFTVDVLVSPGYGGDFSGFNPEFSKYDVMVMNYGFGGDPWPEKVKKALEAYVQGGGGLVIVHAANNAFPGWSEWNKMIGLGWRALW